MNVRILDDPSAVDPLIAFIVDVQNLEKNSSGVWHRPHPDTKFNYYFDVYPDGMQRRKVAYLVYIQEDPGNPIWLDRSQFVRVKLFRHVQV